MVCGVEESGVEECYMRTFILLVFLFLSLSFVMEFSFCSSTVDIE